MTPPILAEFRAASADLLRMRTLQQRFDRKYLLTPGQLPSLLATLRTGYHILMAAGRTVARYETLYFDTPDRQAYHDHRRDRFPRCKVRLRHHLDRQRTFLEIKSKRAAGRTTKARMELPFGQRALHDEGRRFIATHCAIPADLLEPCVVLTFVRVTLLGVSTDERVTLDWQVAFRDESRTAALPNVAIAEIKQGRHSNHEGAARALRQLRIREQRVSKYCVASASLTPVNSNTFKPTLRALAKLGACNS